MLTLRHQAWSGNLIHWGGNVVPGCERRPRSSVAVTFVAPGVRSVGGSSRLLSLEDIRCMQVKDRMRCVSRSLLAHSAWYDLATPNLLPARYLEPRPDTL